MVTTDGTSGNVGIVRICEMLTGNGPALASLAGTKMGWFGVLETIHEDELRLHVAGDVLERIRRRVAEGDDEPSSSNDDSDAIFQFPDVFGVKVYLVGTAHISAKSKRLVSAALDELKPTEIALELCRQRSGIIASSGEDVQKESPQSIRDVLKRYLNARRALSQSAATVAEDNGSTGESGQSSGGGAGDANRRAKMEQDRNLLLLLLSYMMQKLSKDLGAHVGDEFRAAFEWVQRTPSHDGVQLSLIDRPVGITIKRAWGGLSCYERVKFIGMLILTAKLSISEQDLESLKGTDMLTEAVEKLRESFPRFFTVLLPERDLYMALQLYARARRESLRWQRYKEMQESGSLPEGSPAARSPVIVAVVGMGHVRGMLSCWKALLIPDVQRRKEVLKQLPSQHALVDPAAPVYVHGRPIYKCDCSCMWLQYLVLVILIIGAWLFMQWTPLEPHYAR